MVLEARGKIVGPVILGYEIKVRDRSRVDGSQEGVFAGIADRSGRESGNDIGVIGSGSHQILSGYVAIEILYSIDDGRIALERDFLSKTIVEHRRDKRLFFGERCLLFDDRGHDNDFSLRDAQFRCPAGEVRPEDFLELMDHHLDDFLRVHLPEQVISVGEEVAFQGRSC